VNSRLKAVANRTLTPDEYRAYVNHPIAAEERDGVLELVRWFTTRYPTPVERLAYVRRASARWAKTRPVTSGE
jgi:hypothetical protein